MKNKMKVIDLLIRIANREKIPHKIRFEDTIYIYYAAYAGYYEENHYGEQKYKFLNFRNEQYYTILNTEIEIIEEVEKPKEIKPIRNNQNRNEKINQIIDAVNYLLKKEGKK